MIVITNQEYLYSIRKCYLFDGIKDEQLTEAIKLLNGRIRKVEKDDFIVQLGGVLRNAGLLLKGKIESSFQNENYDQITMHTFGGGYLFGEAIVINSAKNSPVQVRAVEDSIVLFIDLSAIYQSEIASTLRMILAENLIKSLARKNLILNQKVRILSQKSLRDRILIYLGTLPKRSALSRELGRMQNEGLLIVDKEKMKRIKKKQNKGT